MSDAMSDIGGIADAYFELVAEFGMTLAPSARAPPRSASAPGAALATATTVGSIMSKHE